MNRPEALVIAVLAAGLSTRFPGDKLLHPFQGRPLAAHVASTIAALPYPRVAICPRGNLARAELFAAHGFDIVDNPAPARGLASSLALAAGVAQSRGADAVLICLADMPGVTTAHIEALIDALGQGDVVATEANGVRSPPAIFARTMFAELMTLSGDRGARPLLDQAQTVPAASDLVQDFDSAADFG